MNRIIGQYCAAIVTAATIFLASAPVGRAQQAAAAPNATAADAESLIPVSTRTPVDLRLTQQRDADTVEGTQALSLSLCESAHADYCTHPKLRLDHEGQKILEGIRITPKIEGEWRIENYSDYALRFTPAQPWHAGQKYSVTMEKAPFPPAIQIVRPSLSFTSAPFRSRIARMEFLQSPSDMNRKLIASEITFNYPVEDKTVQAALRFELNGKSLPFDWTLDTASRQLNVSTPIEALGDATQSARLLIAPTLTDRTGVALSPDRNSQREQRVTLPSRSSYLKIEGDDIDTDMVTNPSYVPEQLMTMRWNAPVRNQSLAEHVELYLLPKDKPVEGLSPKKDYHWEAANELNPAQVAQLPKIAIRSQPGPEESASQQTFKIDGPGGRYALLRIREGVEAEGGYVLGQAVERVIHLPEYEKDVKIMSEGSVLSLSGERKLSLVSYGNKKLAIRLSRVKSSNINHLVSQSSGSFSSPRFGDYDFNEDNLSLAYEATLPLVLKDEKTPQYTSLDFTQYLKKDSDGRGLFFLTVSDDAGREKEKRFVLVTDLGIIVKENHDGTKDVFVQSLKDGGPVSGAKVQIIGANGESVLSEKKTEKTAGDGHVRLPNMAGYGHEKTPVAYLVRKEDDLSFMPYAREDRQVNTSAFPIEGLNHSKNGLKAYLFSDRGIYRPGETIQLGMIVKAADWDGKKIDGLPLTLELTNSLGRVIDSRTLALNAEGVAEYKFTTLSTSATGIYTANLYLGRTGELGEVLGSVPVRVEEFQPDKLRIASRLEQSGKPIAQGKSAPAWVAPEALTATVDLEHLYGAPAAHYKVTGKLTLAPATLDFEDAHGYKYEVGNVLTQTFEHNLTSTETDDHGKAKFDLPLADYRDATFRMSVMSEGFEPESGRSVRSMQSLLVSNLPYLVGMRSDANLSYLYQNAEAHLSLQAIDAARRPVAAPKPLTAEIRRIDYVSTLVKDERGSYQYQSVPVEKSISTEPLPIAAEGGQWNLPTANPGHFRAILRNETGVVMVDQTFNIAGEGKVTVAADQKATLQVTMNKGAYQPGDRAELHLMAPYAGSGLITLETDHIVAHRWFTAENTSSVQSIDIPKDFEGKGFVSVQFTRARNAEQIFMSPFSFAIVPIEVSPAARDQGLSLEAPATVTPGSTVGVTVHSAKPGTAVVYAVDEGILLFAKYKTPDPLKYFVLNRALEVRTSQIMDLLLPEYSILARLSRTGGDGYLGDGKNLNPFKRKTLPPVAFWSGIVEVGPQAGKWSFTLPEHFDGRLRIIAVGAGDASLGVTEKTTSVVGPLVLTPNLPLFAAPGDRFEVPVTVANRSVGSGAKAVVKLVARPSAGLEILGGGTPALTIPEGTEQTVRLTLRAKDMPGEASLDVTAELNGTERHQSQSMSIRPALASATTLVSGKLGAGETTLPAGRAIYAAYGSRSVTASPLPLALVQGLKTYLDHFPYGCNEQITSKALPGLLLLAEPDMMKELRLDAKAMRTGANRYIRAIRERQNEEGGFGRWSSYESSDPFLTAYVMHALTRARKLGIAVPDRMWDDGQRALETIGGRTPYGLSQASGIAYALYVHTLNGDVTTNQLSTLVATLERDYPKLWRGDSAALYIAGTYALLQLTPEATQLFTQYDAFHTKPAPSRREADEDGHDLFATSAAIPDALFLQMIDEHATALHTMIDMRRLARVMEEVYNQQYNSLSAAFGVQALLAYSKQQSSMLDSGAFSARGLAGDKPQPLPLAGNLLRKAKVPLSFSALVFSNQSGKPFYYQIATDGFDRQLPDKPIAKKMEIESRFLNLQGEPIAKAALGETLLVDIALRAATARDVPNMALVALLPAGFEIVPPPKKAAVARAGDEGATVSDDGDTARDTADIGAENGNGRDGGPSNASDSDADITMGNVTLPQWHPEFVDRREDRLVAYGRVNTTGQVYRFRVKPTVRGDFVVPPPMAESMYDPQIIAREVPRHLQVE